MLSHPPSWFDAWVDSAYGPGGFWTGTSPAAHFRTAAGLGPELAEAVLALLDRTPGLRRVLDVGAGDGRLLADLHARRPDLELTGVDLRPRPTGVPTAVGWRTDRWDGRAGRWTEGTVPALLGAGGPTLVLALEWLDDLPCRLARRVVAGHEAGDDDPWSELAADGTPAGPLAEEDRDWVRTWWPDGDQVEVGLTRDRAWAWLLGALAEHGGLALMVDYGHERASRPRAGSSAGYRDGREVAARPTPDRNLSAHVAVDAVQRAGERAGARTLLRARQRDALTQLLPPVAPSDPLTELAARSRRQALGASAGWGTHWWLLQEVPAAL